MGSGSSQGGHISRRSSKEDTSARARFRLTRTQRWQAHETKVVGLAFINNDRLLVTATFDVARLWTEEGALVGDFGQSKLWDLGRVETWAYRTPRVVKETADKEGGAEKGQQQPDGSAQGKAGGGDAGSEDGSKDGESEIGWDSGQKIDRVIEGLSQKIKQCLTADLERQYKNRLEIKPLSPIPRTLFPNRVKEAAKNYLPSKHDSKGAL
ncbi:hypothetical protein CBR_g28811 [Chara braunii]|uniref:Uncharacterized protein n=1 Tax=Chara braunii TaxID=69332 RepID=A0A388L9V1_CHABU|nr:hypothetical protein CBR_g28811 [Chara braunii]|eukprot:GBG79095.1 hypothetical protein CBR_g28811 [Chara braunii]